MSQARAAIGKLRDNGVKATYTHVFVRAVALSLARNPQLHNFVRGSKRYEPYQVDIGLSVSGSSVVAPVMVIEGADKKSLADIAQEIIARAPEVRERNDRMLARLNRYGGWVPFGWLRRLVVRMLMTSIAIRHASAGTFQVSCLNEVDQFAPLLLTTGAIIGTGRVRDRAVVLNGALEVRPTVIITCCADHKAWDGIRAGNFLADLKSVLESDRLARDGG